MDPHSTAESELQSQLLLPSQLLYTNNSMQLPPSPLFSENIPVIDTTVTGSPSHGHQAVPWRVGPGFAVRANDLINESLGRRPGGTSVVEADSVLEESGRLYHGYKEGKYLIPNDAAEQDRLDLQHHVWLLLLDGWLHLAPMTTVPKYVLDIATGTGIWAHDFAEKYPDSFVIGNDLSLVQPEPRVPNLVFQKDDVEDEWVFPVPHPPDAQSTNLPWEENIKFDYVHLRMVFTCFSDPRLVMRHAFDNMNPGGWIEYQDASFAINGARFEGSPFEKYCQGCTRGAATLGRDLLVSQKYKAYLEEVGFVDVQERQMILPTGPWAHDRRLKQVGLWHLQNTLEGLKPVGWKMLKLAGYSPEEIETIVRETEEQAKDVRNQIYTPVHVVYGRKPLPY